MLERVKEGDHNYISGLRKYIAAYKAMQRSHAPTASIVYAFHSFGRPDRKLNRDCLIIFRVLDSIMHKFLHTGYVWSQGRRGCCIRTNSTGIMTTTSWIPRGTEMAPQGRPIKHTHGAQDLPIKAKRQKWGHNLSAATPVCTIFEKSCCA